MVQGRPVPRTFILIPRRNIEIYRKIEDRKSKKPNKFRGQASDGSIRVILTVSIRWSTICTTSKRKP